MQYPVVCIRTQTYGNHPSGLVDIANGFISAVIKRGMSTLGRIRGRLKTINVSIAEFRPNVHVMQASSFNVFEAT